MSEEQPQSKAFTMQRQLISSGSPFEAHIGYSRAVVQGDWVFVSGTTGFDYATMEISPEVETQARQCLENIRHALAQAGASLADVVRVHYILPNGADFERCWPVLSEYFGDVRPAATVISTRLLDPHPCIEIRSRRCDKSMWSKSKIYLCPKVTSGPYGQAIYPQPTASQRLLHFATCPNFRRLNTFRSFARNAE